jgi:hypothetical protein
MAFIEAPRAPFEMAVDAARIPRRMPAAPTI